MQVRDHIAAILKFTDIKVHCTFCDCSNNEFVRVLQHKVCAVVGGMSIEKQRRVLSKRRPQIVVATPGRLWELAEEVCISPHRKYLSETAYLEVRMAGEPGTHSILGCR